MHWRTVADVVPSRVALVASWLIVSASCASQDVAPAAPDAAVGSGNDSTLVAATSERSDASTAATTAVAAVNAPPIAAHKDGRVLAAAVLWRATVGNSWDTADRFRYFYIVERVGRVGADGFITDTDSGRVLGDEQRAAIEAALAPRRVEWVESWDAVVDEEATTTLPGDRAIITVAEPMIDGARAEVATELWCGFDCAIGSTSVLEQSADGDWTVTDQLGGYIS